MPSLLFPLFLLVAMFVALLAEPFMPMIPDISARVALMPVIFFYAAVALPTWGMLPLAFAGGLMWDLLHVQVLEETVEISLGWSVILYGVLGGVMSGFRPWFQRGRWEVHCLLCGIFTAAIPLAEFLMLSIRRLPVSFEFTPAIWWRIGGTGLAAMFLAPFVFYGFNYLAHLIGYDFQPPEEVAEDGYPEKAL